MRLFDFITVSIGFLFLSPLFIVIMILIKIFSPGPIFYHQQRIGRNGILFRLYKFRSMVVNADRIGTSVTTEKDPRITPIGRFLRKTKIDELPQLWNVLKGDMSLVGPRPDVPEIVQKYTPEMKRIFQIRPGITSVATLHLRDEEAILARVQDPERFYENVLVPLKVKLAMEHVDRNSFAFDLKILFQTIWMLTLGRWWPIKEHPAIAKLREKIERDYTEKTKGQI